VQPRAGNGDEAAALAAARAALARASRAVADAGLVAGTAGNLSLRVGELVAITPTGAVLAALEADDITVLDAAGGVVEGALQPTSELDLHLGAHERYRPGAVVHTHSPYATALACVLDELPCIHYEMLPLGGTVRVAPYRTFGTPELAAVTLDALAGRRAALMCNHGAIVLGDDLDEAVQQARLLERMSELYWRAAAIGSPRTLDLAQRGAVADAVSARGYGRPRRLP
jgi:L-fuculose-phosphate aldolase